MHEYLVSTVRRLGRERKAEFRGNADVASRRIGSALANRIYKLIEEREAASQPNTEIARNSLVTMSQVDAWVKENMPDLITFSSTTKTTGNAKRIADGISLVDQVSHNTKAQIGG